jgi:probable rRNA maturation factor
MNKASVAAEEVPLPSWSDSLSGFALKVLDEIKRDNWDLSILLCGDTTITALNTRYRGKAEPTDVLSFNLGAEVQEGETTRYLPGDIVISLDTLRENARYFQEDEDKELRRLVIHGILHLDGMDHDTIDKDEPIIVLQEDILKRLDSERILPAGGEA